MLTASAKKGNQNQTKTCHVCPRSCQVCANVIAVSVLHVALSTVAASWINNYDDPTNFNCPDGQFLSHINSEHSNHHEDRVWNFGCSPVPAEGAVTNCQTTNYVNEWDQTFTFQCPGEGFVTGMDSVHNNHYEDRRFKFHCCEFPGALAHRCYFTNWENEMDHTLDYLVPNGKILRGVASYHSNHNDLVKW
ncbi:hemagglutinin/amebocyte aggregation factor-like isoform X2 [Babylonia areolata]|uniref:hemagglutinin/amebocyte aggregation factor-like isoform X2 n=1 Tax=Babylonia areolata TaxID=304850 RepID=UPI003FD352E0